MKVLSAYNGFTLIEVMIALIIGITSITIVLTHVRTLFDLNLRLVEKQQKSTLLLNKIAAFKLIKIEQPNVTEIDDFTLSLSVQDEYNSAIQVKNFTPASNEPDVAISITYTPYQKYTLLLDSPTTKYKEQVSFILKGLTPPE